jgi:hypothetical protein
MSETVVRVGISNGDVRGSDNLALQEAVDRVVERGGGTVRIGPGEYVLRNSLFLRSGVRIEGSGPETVLRKAPMKESALADCAAFGMMDLAVEEPDGFGVGDGVYVGDPKGVMGFHGTVATIIWKEGNRLGVGADNMKGAFLGMMADYAPPKHTVRTLFPVISGTAIRKASISNLTIEGNAAENGYLDGCRGGGIFLLRADDVAIRNVTVRDYNGEGISFQQCRRTMVEDCVSEKNRGNGLHPGSGSVGAVMRRVKCHQNGQDGVFYCLRVTWSLLEDCEIAENGRHGISIGGRDSDNLIRRCRILGNASHGIYFRENSPFGMGHRNRIEGCTIVGNCRERDRGQVRIDAPVRDIQIVDCTLGGPGKSDEDAGIYITADGCSLALSGNAIAAGREVAIGEGVSGVEILRDGFPDLAAGPDRMPEDADWHLG